MTPAQRMALGCLAVLLFGLPIVMWNGFFAVTEAKAVFFWLVGGVFALVFLALNCRRSAQMGVLPLRLSAGEKAFLAFFGILLLASLLGGDPLSAVFGADNRYQGLLTALLYLILYLGFVRCNVPAEGPLKLGLAAFFLCAALGIMNHLGFDPLGTLKNLSDFDRGRYVSTLGNINFFGSYICLFLPALLFLACACAARRQRLLFYLVSALGTAACMAARSESAVLGMAVAVLLLPVALADRPAAFRRLPVVLITVLAAMCAMRGASLLCGGARFSELTEALLSPAALIAALGALIALYALLLRTEDVRLVKLRKPLLIAYAAFAMAFAAALVLFSTVLKSVPLGGAARYLRLGTHWGTDRGAIWQFCIKTYEGFPLWQKLIGGGPGCILRADQSYGLFADALLDTAHNEYLQYLLTTGALGLVSYLAVLFFTVRESILCDKSAISRALLLGFAAYTAQAVVNIAQPASTPLFFVVLAVLHARAKA